MQKSVTFEMSIAPLDVTRLLPVAVNHEPFRQPDPHTYLAGTDARGWKIMLTRFRERRIALLTLPVLDLTLTWWGYDQIEIDDFLENFHRGFQRGGG